VNNFKFKVIDKKWNKEIDENIWHEDWAMLLPNALRTIALTEEGELIMIDVCNNIIEMPEDRYVPLFEQDQWITQSLFRKNK
jgi:hypothetical protein